MPSFKILRPMAFKPLSEQAIPNQTFYKLAFPVRWYNELYQEWKQIKKSTSYDPEPVSLPTAALNKTLRAIVPDLIRVMHIDSRKDLVWLYSSRPIDTADLLAIVRAWAEVCLSEIPHATLYTMTAGFGADELIWQPCRLDAYWTTHPNNTANPHGDYFTVLPYYLAAELSKYPFSIGDETFALKRYPLSPMHNGAELMGWEPVWYKHRKDTGAFAQYINLTLQSVPFCPEPLLYVHTGVRRFVNPEQKYLKHIKSAVIQTSASWIQGQDYTHSFQVAELALHKPSTGDWQLTWDDDLVKIIDKLQIGNPLPPASQILGRGQTHRFDAHTSIMPVYNTQVGSHVVSAGASVTDRVSVLDFVLEHISPAWVRVDDFSKLTNPVKTIATSPFAAKSDKTPQVLTSEENDEDEAEAESFLTTEAAARCERITKAMGPVAHLTICYQNEATLAAIKEEWQQLLGVAYDAQRGQFKTPSGFVLQMHIQKAGPLADALPIPAKTVKERAYTAAKSVRQQLIKSTFPDRSSEDSPAGVLFELADQDAFGDYDDPKQAIRQGFAAIGYLTQFINASTKKDDVENLTHRVRRAVLDLLRQWGVSARPVQFNDTGLPSSMHYIGLWVLRFNSRFDGPQTELPVAVRIGSDYDDVWVKGPDFDWTPYAKAQLLLSNSPSSYENVPAGPRRQKITLWLRSILSNLPDNTLLLTDTHNMRLIWKDLANGKLQQDRLELASQLSSPVTAHTGLRMVRLRQDQQHEAPQAYGVYHGKNGLETGRAHGVFGMAERVFVSVGQKPDSSKDSTKGTKYAPFSTSKSDRTDGPNYSVWNPRLLELTMVALQPNDDPALYASVVHQLRRMSLQFNDTTTLPLPLHLADKLEEYVKP